MAKRIAENQAEIYECEHCDKAFTCHKSFLRHMKEVTTDSRIICIVPSCDSTFTRTDSYRYHLTHTHRKDFEFSNEVWKSSTKKILRLMEEQIEAVRSVKNSSKPSQAAATSTGNGGEDDSGNSISQIATSATRSNAVLSLKRTIDAPKQNLRIQENENAPLATSSTNAEAVIRRVKTHLPTVRKMSGMTTTKIEANDSGKKDDDTPQRLSKKRKIEVPIAKDNIQDIAESHAPFTASSTNSDAKRLKWAVPVKKFHIPPFETKGDNVNIGELRDYFVGMAQMFCDANETVKVIRKELAIEMETTTVSATTTAEMVSDTLPSTPPCPAVSIQDYHDDDDNLYLPSTPRSLAVSLGDYDDDKSIDDNVHLDLFS